MKNPPKREGLVILVAGMGPSEEGVLCVLAVLDPGIHIPLSRDPVLSLLITGISVNIISQREFGHSRDGTG